MYKHYIVHMALDKQVTSWNEKSGAGNQSNSIFFLKNTVLNSTDPKSDIAEWLDKLGLSLAEFMVFPDEGRRFTFNRLEDSEGKESVPDGEWLADYNLYVDLAEVVECPTFGLKNYDDE